MENGAPADSFQAVDNAKIALGVPSQGWEDNFQFWEVLNTIVPQEA